MWQPFRNKRFGGARGGFKAVSSARWAGNKKSRGNRDGIKSKKNAKVDLLLD